MDATRVSDGLHVALKKVVPGDNHEEVNIALFLNTEPLRSDLRNNAMPVYEVMDVPGTERDGPVQILVTPLLRPWDDPWFKSYGEALAFFTQMFNV